MSSSVPPNSPVDTVRGARTLRTVLIVAGSIVLVLIILSSALSAVASHDRGDHSTTFIVSEPVDALGIEAGASDLTVRYADIPRPRVVFDSGGTGLRLSHDVSGGRLSLSERGGEGWHFVSWSWNAGSAATLTVELPASLAADAPDLDLDVTAGDVSVAGSYGDVTVESAAGEVTVSGEAANLGIETTAGDVHADDLAVSGDLTGESVAGDVQYDLATAPATLRLETTAGDQHVTLPEGAYRISTDTTAGSVDNQLGSDPDSARVYRFTSTAGDITLGRS